MAQLSYVNGVSELSLKYETIGQLLSNTTANHGERMALISAHQDIRWTYREFQDRVNNIAQGLLVLGLERGDRLGIWAPNCAEWALVQFATAKIGVILVNINPAYRLSELEYALGKVGCKALVLAESFKSSNYVRMIRELIPSLAESGDVASPSLPHLKILIKLGSDVVSGMHRFDELYDLGQTCATPDLDQIGSQLNPEEAINIQFTSGTTGNPKGATLSHMNIVNNGFAVGERLQLIPEDGVCIPVPLYHCFGMVMGNLACVCHGATMVYPSPSFEAEATLATIEAERCTAVYGVPTMFIALLSNPRFCAYNVSSLRTGIMAGAPCPVDVMKRVASEMHMREVTIAYGMTETSPISFQSTVDDPLEIRVETVGRVLPHVEVKIVDASGRTTSLGEPGELCTRGYSVMKGYWGDPEKTREVIDADGWMHTGDLATLDEHGYCRITGRLKDMIIRGGENIYPREIEEFLYSCPGLKDAQVFGVPDYHYGEEICAWVTAHPGQVLTAELIRNHCQGRISHHKIPRHIRIVDSFPMTVTGKVQKFRMREIMLSEL